MVREWDCQVHWHQWGLQLGFHIDHMDPSITLHLPFAIIGIGRLKQPGFRKDKQK